MSSSIVKNVLVQNDGTVEVCSPLLKVGTEVEVTVSVPDQRSPQEVRAAFKAMKKAFNLTPDQAEAWIEEMRQERASFGPQE